MTVETCEDAVVEAGLPYPSRSKKISCPKHDDKTPSLHLYEYHFHCFACGEHGDAPWLYYLLTGEWKGRDPNGRSSATRGLGKHKVEQAPLERLRKVSLQASVAVDEATREFDDEARAHHRGHVADLIHEAHVVLANCEPSEGDETIAALVARLNDYLTLLPPLLSLIANGMEDDQHARPRRRFRGSLPR